MRKKGKYRGVTYLTDQHGRRRYRVRLTIKGRKIQGYIKAEPGTDEFERQYAALLNGERGTTTKRDTFAFLTETFKASPGFKSLAGSTKRNKLRDLDWINERIGQGRYAEMTPLHVEALMAKRKGDTSANRLRSVLGELFDHATKRHGYSKPNPARLADPVRIKSDGIPTWNAAEIASFRATHQSGTTARLAFELLYGTAAARSDVVAMTLANLKDGSLTYCRKKTGVRATLPVTAELQRELDRLPDGQLMLLTNSRGAAYKVATFNKAFHRWCLEAGVPKSSHGLRKARAVALAEAGASQTEIAAFLGHATPQQTATYTRAADRAALAANAAERENKTRSNVVQPCVQPSTSGS